MIAYALAYEFTILINDILVDQPVDSAEQIVGYFKEVAGRDSVCGKYYFRESPTSGMYFSFPLDVKTFNPGGLEIIKTVKAL